MRALAKDPDQRYASAEEMDADLARVARGASVSQQTEEAMTQVLAESGVEHGDDLDRAAVRGDAPAGAARLPAAVVLRGGRPAALAVADDPRDRRDRDRRRSAAT